MKNYSLLQTQRCLLFAMFVASMLLADSATAEPVDAKREQILRAAAAARLAHEPALLK